MARGQKSRFIKTWNVRRPGRCSTAGDLRRLALHFTIGWGNSIVPMDVRAAVVHGPNQPFVMETLQLERPREGEVLVHIKTTGLCHSDLHVYEGKLPWAFPALLGHEAAGVVVECGPGVPPFAGRPRHSILDSSLRKVRLLPFQQDQPVRRSVLALEAGRVPLLAERQAGDAAVGLGTFADYSVLPVEHAGQGAR